LRFAARATTGWVHCAGTPYGVKGAALLGVDVRVTPRNVVDTVAAYV